MRLMNPSRCRYVAGAGFRGRRRTTRDDRGQALVEFVLALPILLVIVFGIIEFATAWRTYQIVTNVAREGARLGVTPQGQTQDVINRIDSLLVWSNLSLAKRTATLSCINPSNGSTTSGACSPLNGGYQFRVRLQYQHTFVVLGPVLNLMCGGCGTGYGTVSLNTESVMRSE